MGQAWVSASRWQGGAPISGVKPRDQPAGRLDGGMDGGALSALSGCLNTETTRSISSPGWSERGEWGG